MELQSLELSVELPNVKYMEMKCNSIFVDIIKSVHVDCALCS